MKRHYHPSKRSSVKTSETIEPGPTASLSCICFIFFADFWVEKAGCSEGGWGVEVTGGGSRGAGRWGLARAGDYD
jgi:hypothetical protein